MVALDTDALILAFAFQRDRWQADNTRFLATVQENTSAVAIYTVMELLGKLSFNLSVQRLRQWTSWLQDRYQLTILYPQNLQKRNGHIRYPVVDTLRQISDLGADVESPDDLSTGLSCRRSCAQSP